MAEERIRVLLVDDSESTVQAISALLKLEADLEVVGSAADGVAGVEQAQRLRPDVVLMDVNMPRLDGITACEQLTTLLPATAVVMLTAHGDTEYLRRSMNVGASYFLTKPVAADELYHAVRRAHEVSRLRNVRFVAAPATPAPSATVLALFSPSGGVGRTTIAVHLAAALRRVTDARVGLVDLSLPFGDVGVLLNAPPTSPNIGDFVGKFAEVEADDLEHAMFAHRSGVRALLAPPSPETEERIAAEDVRRVLDLLRTRFAYVVVDTWPSYDERMLTVLESADEILVPLSLELTSVKNARVFAELAAKLGLDGKLKLVVNRAGAPGGLKIADVESGLGRKVAHTLASDEAAVRTAMNRGLLIFESHADRKLATDYLAMARGLAGTNALTAAAN